MSDDVVDLLPAEIEVGHRWMWRFEPAQPTLVIAIVLRDRGKWRRRVGAPAGAVDEVATRAPEPCQFMSGSGIAGRGDFSRRCAPLRRRRIYLHHRAQRRHAHLSRGIGP